MTRNTRLALVVLSTASALALAGCSDSEPERDPEGVVTETAAGADVFALKVGDCTMGFNEDTEVAEVDIVPCDQPHVDEYYASVIVEGDAYPGDEAMWAQADTECAAQFETFVGIPYQDSQTLWLSYLTPTQDSWEDGDREILCSVYEDGAAEGALTTGSLKGAAR